MPISLLPAKGHGFSADQINIKWMLDAALAVQMMNAWQLNDQSLCSWGPLGGPT